MAKKSKYCEETEILARYAQALVHPARISIMQFLAKRNTCYFGDIHEELPIAKATVSQHLKELKEAGLIQGEIETPLLRFDRLPGRRQQQAVHTEFFGDVPDLLHVSGRRTRLPGARH